MVPQRIQNIYNLISKHLLEIFPTRGNDPDTPIDPEFEKDFANTTIGQLFLEDRHEGLATYMVNLGKYTDTVFEKPKTISFEMFIVSIPKMPKELENNMKKLDGVFSGQIEGYEGMEFIYGDLYVKIKNG
jgi:hypothetical protein